MVIRSRFNFQSFADAWPAFSKLAPVNTHLEDVRPEQRVGLATLALIGTRREYWVALGAIASYADEVERSIPDLLAALSSPGGELPYSGAEQIAGWAAARPLSEAINREQLTTAIYTVGAACRPEAIAMAAESGGAFTICRETYEPDWKRVWECVRRALGS